MGARTHSKTRKSGCSNGRNTAISRARKTQGKPSIKKVKAAVARKTKSVPMKVKKPNNARKQQKHKRVMRADKKVEKVTDKKKKASAVVKASEE